MCLCCFREIINLGRFFGPPGFFRVDVEELRHVYYGLIPRNHDLCDFSFMYVILCSYHYCDLSLVCERFLVFFSFFLNK